VVVPCKELVDEPAEVVPCRELVDDLSVVSLVVKALDEARPVVVASEVPSLAVTDELVAAEVGFGVPANGPYTSRRTAIILPCT